MNNISPSYHVEYLHINVVEHDYGLRNNNDIRLPQIRTLSYRNYFIPSVIRTLAPLGPGVNYFAR